MKTKFTFLCFLLLSLTSCLKNGGQYSNFQDLPENHQWKKSDAKTFDFTIDNDIQLYDIAFTFSHVYDYQFNSVPIDFVMEHPDGTKEKFSIDLKIKDSSGKELADCSGDVCDLNYTVKEGVALSKGTYKVIVSNNFNGPYLPNVIGVGLEVNAKK